MQSAEQRTARRAFIRAHHPDVGGDTTEFIAGLQEWEQSRPPAPTPEPTSAVRVHVIAHRAWPYSLLRGVLRRVERGRHPRVR